MKRIRVDELKVGDRIALSDGSVIVGETTVTAIEIVSDLPAYRILTLDGKRTVMQRGDDKVTVIDAKMEMKGNEENHE